MRSRPSLRSFAYPNTQFQAPVHLDNGKDPSTQIFITNQRHHSAISK